MMCRSTSWCCSTKDNSYTNECGSTHDICLKNGYMAITPLQEPNVASPPEIWFINITKIHDNMSTQDEHLGPRPRVGLK